MCQQTVPLAAASLVRSSCCLCVTRLRIYQGLDAVHDSHCHLMGLLRLNDYWSWTFALAREYALC